MVNYQGNQQSKECTNESISVEGVSKKFGKVQALDGVNLRVDPGMVFALLGPNGSGKTTMVRILTTLLRPDKGTVRVGGYDVIKDPGLVRSITGLAGQYPAVDENLTGRENLEMIGNLYHLGKQKCKVRTDELLENFDLINAANRRAKTYSGGMRRRLDLAAALVGNPSILFLDEPTTGLDPRSRLGLWEVISTQAKNCNTVFLTTQNLEEADHLAARIAIMEAGKIIRTGSPQELKDCCGGESQVRIRLLDRSKTQQAVEVLSELGKNRVHSIPETGEVSLPATEGTAILSEVVRYLDRAGIAVAELGLRQPALDDVFLAITGHTAEKPIIENQNQDHTNKSKGE
ncbi:MAG: ATP-binding cassette domain-containing protein [Chloroflexi bacterium]|nr:ATP-binding cassette domain-containing protein [Chloroflexota bacterium]